MVRPSDQTAKKVTHTITKVCLCVVYVHHTLQSDKKKLIFLYHEVHRSLTMIREMKLVRDTHTYSKGQVMYYN